MQPSTLFVILSAIAPFAAAVCCRANGDGICGDGTTGTPYCGYGPCDWTGCNCDGGTLLDETKLHTTTLTFSF